MAEPLPNNSNTDEPGPSGPGFAVSVRSIPQAEQLINSLTARIVQLERMVADHDHRFDTLQTPWPKRVWFWIDGWPWYNLNGKQRRRFWHRRDGR